MIRLGSFLIGDMHVVLSNDMIVEEAFAIASQIEDQTIKEFGEFIEMNVIIELYRTKIKIQTQVLGSSLTQVKSLQLLMCSNTFLAEPVK
jgi:divalent metal cation (Fe/Co/Zn/Cd) transporter